MKGFGRIFLTGLLTLLPVVATVYFVFWVLALLERFFGKPMLLLIPDEWYRTGMGLAVAVAVIFGVGLLMQGLIFRKLYDFIERVLLGVPLVRSVYSALRDLLGLFSGHDERALQVVSVALPGMDMRLVGFVTRSDFGDLPAGIGREGEVAVYLPMSYQIGGYTVFVPRSRVEPVGMSREEAMKFVLTAGLKSKSGTDANLG